ncbi:MAG: glutamine--fructose-6-phosphate transaminase (isomerizing) [Candidatus Methanomethylicota archaeon]|uniref:Glutamine--fructose-6-phosphate aminotransferase [isomerizing] n=2 Tax=Thermoproteota archaeon TaxID=2056631 RepID=A0A497F0X1_9CREN|nr:MAG: glutamine--fructose-6-phosphate transaminase (isomerizing) [Candidatus Verstraetearchaeota archaeon]
MCGIFGCVSNSDVSQRVYQGLKRLEYRGYDSVGLATICEGKILVKKDKGKIEEVNTSLKLTELPGNIGIGHTRWATHGAPSAENAHPHLDCKGLVAVVHNGVLENFLTLRKELEERGHVFKSRTDTEVFPHLIEDFLLKGYDLCTAVMKAISKVEGSYAIAVISPVEPDKIVCARKESPLIIGISKDAMYCASDIPALLPFTNKVVVLRDGDVAIITKDSLHIKTVKGEVREPELLEVNWPPELAEKGGFPHFMLKEIVEQPLAMRNTLRISETYLKLMSSLIDNAEHLILTGSGTSFHACLAGTYMLSYLAKKPSKAIISSELPDTLSDSIRDGTVILAISQSGETADTLSAIRFAKEKGAKILGITNVIGSSITRLSEVYVCTQAGPEIGVAATKTFTTQLIALALLSCHTGLLNGSLTRSEFQNLMRYLDEIPKYAERVIEQSQKTLPHIVKRYSKYANFYFLGRGISVPTALEGALKLKEISYVHAEGYPAGESKHGPIALVDDNFPCVFIAPPDRTRAKIIGNVMEMKARGSKIFSIIGDGDEELKSLSDDVITMPNNVPEAFTPILYVIPLQLFAYQMAVELGRDPDKPRNLAKSVTVM